MLLFISTTPVKVLQRVAQIATRVNILFIATVVAPVTLATLYFGWIASDIYVSESRFVLRSQQRPQVQNPLGALLGTVGMTRSQDDAYTVQDFIASRDALRRLD